MSTQHAYAHVTFISAGAGSGKTYRLTQELEHALVRDGMNPARVIGTTFTVKAAEELRERVRERLIRSGRPQLAEQSTRALIGTVHSVCERLLKRFAFELGLSPELNVVSVEDSQGFFHQALDAVLDPSTVGKMNEVADRLGLPAWQNDVKRIADAARNNDIQAGKLEDMGRRNAADFLSFFPAPREGDWDAALLEAVRDALHAIDLSLDTTRKTAGYVADMKSAIYRLRRPPCPWPLWIGLARKSAAKKSEALAAKVRAAASSFECHPRFHADVRSYIELAFRLAGLALERFQALKKERGLIDFTDMEQLMLQALDEPAVRERLRGELELLLVDEFQDTNPMQLAIFMKLARLADKVVFVGDVKQAIYAFRGCDPDLVFATLEALAKAGGESDALRYSWRSRPALVSYVNAVFTTAFEGEIDRQDVILEPKREETPVHPALHRWTLPGNWREQAASIAEGIRRLMRSGTQVVDPDSGRLRPLRWGDIAVLAATNDHVETIARALRAAHVPMKMTLRGLLSVPEVVLAKACLRRLNDVTDTLATAEIIALADCTDPEAWLENRLQWLDAGEDPYRWAEASHPILQRLAALRDGTATQSPVEIVARVLNYVTLRRVVTAWGPNAIKAAQRQRNLDAFLNLAVEYERHCEGQHVAATLTGFLFWLENPQSPELDLQPVVTTGDAVHVLTYHKSKGLEWPVVVACDLHYEWQSRLWNVRVERGDGDFDIAAPLSERLIRFWPKVLGDASNGIDALERIKESAEGRDCDRKGRSEVRRLAYVGLTRARDTLVLALPGRNPGRDCWIRAFESAYLPPTQEELQLADGTRVECATLDLADSPPDAAPAPSYTPRWFPPREPSPVRRKELLFPSQASPAAGATVAEIARLGGRIPVRGEDMATIGRALHAVLAAELVNPSGDLERAAAILHGFRSAEQLEPRAALQCAARLLAWIGNTFDPSRILVEVPMVHRLNDGRVARGWIDVMLETRDGWVILDHKSSPRPRAEWHDEALEHSGQLAHYAQALTAAGLPVAGTWIHFPITGGAVRIAL